MTAAENVKLVLSYFDACNSGDIDALKSHFAPDIVHYFLPDEHKAVRSAEHLAKYWEKFHRLYRPKWRIDHTVAAGDEVVSEWSCAYFPKGASKQSIFRGTEWYVITDGKITEIRAYYHFAFDRDCELTEFPYAERGYLTKQS